MTNPNPTDLFDLPDQRAFPKPSCPSDLQLDRLYLGALAEDAQNEAKRHIEGCATCAERLEMRNGGFAALGIDGDRLAARIAAAQAAQDRSWFIRLKSFLVGPVLLPCALAACAMVFFSIKPTSPGIHKKGGINLRVIRKRGARVEELKSGEAFLPGDKIRFKVSLPENKGQIMVVGVEHTGRSYTYYPAGQDRSALPKEQQDGVLEGAIELDDYVGEEWLHLIHCPAAFAKKELELRPAKPAVAPRDCKTKTFKMKRTRPKP